METVKQKLSSSLNQISEQICPFKKSTTAGQQHFTETRYGLFLDLGLSSTSKAFSIIYCAQDGQKVEETLRKDGNRGGEKGGSQ